jgi:hypothetical protein
MKKNLLLLVIIIFKLNFAIAGEPYQKVKAFMRIEHTGGGNRPYLLKEDTSIPALPINDEVKQQIAKLKAGDEVVVEGHISQQILSRGDSQTLKSYLIIESIQAVSLGELGKTGMPQLPQDNRIHSITTPYSPPQIPVTTEVASALTMTAGMLLLEDLSSDPAADPERRRQLRQAVLLSSGLMASIIFIYEQIKGEKTKK